MESFMAVYNDAKKKLNRELHEREIRFLRWMYERHVAEQKYNHTC